MLDLASHQPNRQHDRKSQFIYSKAGAISVQPNLERYCPHKESIYVGNNNKVIRPTGALTKGARKEILLNLPAWPSVPALYFASSESQAQAHTALPVGFALCLANRKEQRYLGLPTSWAGSRSRLSYTKLLSAALRQKCIRRHRGDFLHLRIINAREHSSELFLLSFQIVIIPVAPL